LSPARINSGAMSSDQAVATAAGFVATEVPLAPHLLSALQSFDLDRPLREARDAFERAYFEYQLVKEAGSMTRVSEKTGLERTHLYRKLKQLGIDATRNKRGS
jgi:DNA-binding NtrC family response regulator